MKRVFKFLKRNRKELLKGLTISVLTVVAFNVLHEMATAWRGYEAFGGELFALLIPFFIAVVFPVFKESFKDEN